MSVILESVVIPTSEAPMVIPTSEAPMVIPTSEARRDLLSQQLSRMPKEDPSLRSG
jgi:hypothetical protein